MGSGASRPRPQAPPEPQPYPDYTHAAPPPGAQPYYGGGNFTGAFRHGNFQNNGQYYGGYAGQPPMGPPPPGPRAYGPPPPANADKQLNQTATIRNAVNVKKGTIAAAPVPGEPGKLAISFQFDASAPCLVTVLIAAREDAEGSRLTPAKQPAVAGTHYDKGLGLAYPKAGSPGAVVDLSLYSEAELLGVWEGQYPLVIRLETVTDKGLSEGHSLSELAPGGPQRVWVQSQTTFAQLSRDEAGAHGVRPLKQKIWHEGVSYELQEIYGIEHATAAAKEREGLGGGGGGGGGEAEEERVCVICMVNARDTTVLPCRHMCMCHECAHELRKQTSKCPICRNHVESLLHIRMMRGQQTPAPHMGTSAPEPVAAA